MSVRRLGSRAKKQLGAILINGRSHLLDRVTDIVLWSGFLELLVSIIDHLLLPMMIDPMPAREKRIGSRGVFLRCCDGLVDTLIGSQTWQFYL